MTPNWFQMTSGGHQIAKREPKSTKMESEITPSSSMKPPNGKGNRNGAKMTLIRLPLWTHFGTHSEDILGRNNVSEIVGKHTLTMHNIKENCYKKNTNREYNAGKQQWWNILKKSRKETQMHPFAKDQIAVKYRKGRQFRGFRPMNTRTENVTKIPKRYSKKAKVIRNPSQNISEK